jgi:ubiquinone/menaquinone biosynthesis C-methylase UbiE
VDIAEQMVRLGQSRAKRARLRNVTFSVGDMTSLVLADRSVDKVIVSRVLGHYVDLAPIFSELARVLKPKGQCMIINEVRVANFHWYKYLLTAWVGVMLNPSRKAFILDYIQKTPTEAALISACSRAGLHVVEILYDGHIACLVAQKGNNQVPNA